MGRRCPLKDQLSHRREYTRTQEEENEELKMRKVGRTGDKDGDPR